MAIIEGIALGAQVLGGLLGGISESPQERAAREARQRILESARRLDAMSERQRAEADAYGREVESTRLGQAAGIAARANQEAVSLYSRLLSRQRALQSAAATAARAGLNVNVNPALTETFGQVGEAGSQVERNRLLGLLENEEIAQRGRLTAQELRNRADALRMQAEELRKDAEMVGVQGARPSTTFANVLSGAVLGGQVGRALMDINDATRGGIERGLSSLFGRDVPVRVGQEVVPLVANPLLAYQSSSAMVPYLPYREGGENLVGANEAVYRENLMRYNLNRALLGQRGRSETRAFFPLSPPTRIPMVEARALGGRVEAGKPYLVGDSPTGELTGNEEIFIPDQDGTVVPSANTQAQTTWAAQVVNERPYTDFLEMLQQEVNTMSLTDDDIAAVLLAGTGLEMALLGKRAKRRSASKRLKAAGLV